LKLCDIGYLSPEAIGVSRLSSGKPGKKYPENPVNPIKKTIIK
jgi:hypothetical protein